MWVQSYENLDGLFVNRIYIFGTRLSDRIKTTKGFSAKEMMTYSTTRLRGWALHQDVRRTVFASRVGGVNAEEAEEEALHDRVMVWFGAIRVQ